MTLSVLQVGMKKPVYLNDSVGMWNFTYECHRFLTALWSKGADLLPCVLVTF